MIQLKVIEEVDTYIHGSEKGKKNELRYLEGASQFTVILNVGQVFFLQSEGGCLGAKGQCLGAAHSAR